MTSRRHNHGTDGTEALLHKLVPILFEDEHLLAVDKPAGIDAGASANQPADGLAEILAQIRGLGETLTPANRLSRHESGVLLLGKEPTIVAHIRTGLRSSRITQEYLAVVLGKMRGSRIEVGADTGSKTVRRKHSPPKRQQERPRPREQSAARTRINLVEQSPRRALVRCQTTVKSVHALRAELRSVRLPLLGDSLSKRPDRPRRAQPICLHLSKITIHHPARNAKITITSRKPDAFHAVLEGEVDVERPLRAALTRRLACVADQSTDSYRLVTGDAEGIRGLVAEKFGPVAIIQVRSEAATKALDPVARWYTDMLNVQAVYAKRLVKRGASDDEKGVSRPLRGKPVPEQIEIIERGLKFEIRPYGTTSAGLFLDHRENRSRIRTMSEGKDVLNLFAYTCGFSVAAAAGGARRTVSVDLSPGNLDQGRSNFQINGLDLADHEFVTSEAFGYLKAAQRRSEAFDLIILDPPSFAHSRKRGKDFSVARDLPDLVAASLEVLKPGGTMMISTNYHQLALRDLRERVAQGAGRRKF